MQERETQRERIKRRDTKYVCMCVCLSVRVTEREKGWERERERETASTVSIAACLQQCLTSSSAPTIFCFKDFLSFLT